LIDLAHAYSILGYYGDTKYYMSADKYYRQLLDITHVLIKPYILAGGLTLENIPKALILFKPYMIDLIRGVEDKPGKKNLNKINKLLKLIKI
jgi:phosphoribosylanthranilate isomerase